MAGLPLSHVLFAVGYLWALPVTLVGLLSALVGWARPFRVAGGALICCATPKGLWGRFFSSSGMAASAWGGVVFLAKESDLAIGRLMRHELRHFAQARLLGPLMPLAYGLGSLWAVIRGGNSYADNFLERDARAAEAA